MPQFIESRVEFHMEKSLYLAELENSLQMKKLICVSKCQTKEEANLGPKLQAPYLGFLQNLASVFQ